MQKIVIAPDKFKGSLSAIQVCQAIKKGILKHIKNIDVLIAPMADGGDGTVEVIRHYIGGELRQCQVRDPLLRPIIASYLYSNSQQKAYIEMSEASGIKLLSDNELNPLLTSTYGTGQLIKDAINKGARHIILGIGGSATNDAGMGMARALGYQFFNDNGEELGGYGKDLLQLAYIDDSKVNPLLTNIRFEIACDVTNPLYGSMGAAHIYAQQKGANSKMIDELDAGLFHFHNLVKKWRHVDLQNIPGSGAAGGLGAGCVLFLNAELKSGISLIKQLANFNKLALGADWIITGEGKLDEQTFSGKVIKGLIDSVNTQKVAIFCGINELSPDAYSTFKPDTISQTYSYASDLDDSIKNAYNYLTQAAKDFAINFL